MPQIDIYTEPGPIPDGVQLRIYSSVICPYAQRVRLFAAAKGVRTEEINVHLKIKPEWYLAKINPKGQVPTIQLPDGRVINESLIAADYVDEAFDGKKLWPTDPYERAQGRLIVNEFGNNFTSNFYKSYRSEGTDHFVALAKYLETLEEKLKTLGGTFFGGAEANAVDYLIWPWFERLGAVNSFRPKLSESVNKDKFPVLYGWMGRMKEDEAVKKILLPTANHLAFLESVLSGGPGDYGTADLTGEGVKIYTRKE